MGQLEDTVSLSPEMLDGFIEIGEAIPITTDGLDDPTRPEFGEHRRRAAQIQPRPLGVRPDRCSIRLHDSMLESSEPP